MKIKLLVILLLAIAVKITAQEKKTVKALYITTPLTIDGVLDEPVYSEAQPAKDFFQLQPYNGHPSYQPSEVYFFYDQNAIYVGAMLYDSAPDSIFNLFSERDNIGTSDYFGVYIDPYNAGQLAYGFFITPAGVQTDMKAVKNSDGDNEDSNWNAVWESKTRVTDKGWVVELKIPYSALRFSKNAGSSWGVNIFRNIRRYNSNNSWSLVDKKKSGFIDQEGLLTGIKNIKPPVRLSLSPYVATYVESKDRFSSRDFLYKGGMDLKYGLSESFTLDMMLIPDFGQIQSDDKQLNLSPYELYYGEKRQFFNEGTELFQRGNIFYSRRIGASPKFSDRASNLADSTEIIDYNPSETQLVNATKISGRTKNGLGLGVLNAMSLPSYAKLKDTITGATRKVQVQPFTNYNVSVVDKSLKNSSYVSLINSNVSMADNPFRANVTATEFQVRNKAKTYAIKGKGALSTRGDTALNTGFYSMIGIDKNSGKLRYGISQDVYSDKYNPNDLGYLQAANQLNTQTYLSYRILEPHGIFREWNVYSWWYYKRMYKPNAVSGSELGIDSYGQFKNNWQAEVNVGMETNQHDYFETRVEGRYFYMPYYFWGNAWLQSDWRKPLNGYVHVGGFTVVEHIQYGFWGDAGLNVRVGQRLQFDYNFSFRNEYYNRGYISNTANNDTIYFGLRDLRTLSNTLQVSYAFDTKASINFRMRHYWSGVANMKYNQLQPNGTLKEDFNYTNNNDENYNTFNIDLIFRWIFSPGSELTVSWKNSFEDDVSAYHNFDYWKNARTTFLSNKTNSLSLKVLYYIDYNNLVHKHR